MLIINDTTTLTNYHVTGLTNNTLHHVTVTASNNAGSSSSATSILIMTNSNGKSIRPSYVCMHVMKYMHAYSPFVILYGIMIYSRSGKFIR